MSLRGSRPRSENSRRNRVTVHHRSLDAINLPTPERGWPTGSVRVVNTAHAPTCPAFTAFVAETGAAVRLMFASDAGAENLLFRETLSSGPEC